MKEYSRHQQGIIKRYYENRDKIALQRLAELVGELYLADGKKLDRLWKTAAQAMEKLDVPQSRRDHVMEQRDPTLLATLVKELDK